ncbi:MAG: TetR family transcriptional regulator [Microbacterium sp.]
MTPSDTAARRPRSDAQANRRGILDAAAVALANDPHASIDAIARGARLTRRTLYGHFADRESLIRELIAVGAGRFNEIAGSVHHDDARIALALLASRLWAEASGVQVAAAIALDELHVQETADALAPLRATVLRIVRRGQADGTLREDIPAGTLARLIEESARMAITRLDVTSPEARGLVVRTVLGIAGLSWRECAELLQSEPSILEASS